MNGGEDTLLTSDVGGSIDQGMNRAEKVSLTPKRGIPFRKLRLWTKQGDCLQTVLLPHLGPFPFYWNIFEVGAGSKNY